MGMYVFCKFPLSDIISLLQAFQYIFPLGLELFPLKVFFLLDNERR